MFLKVLENLFFQSLFLIGIIVLFAAVIGFLNKLFHRLIGKSAKIIEITTGFVGTPVHELGHALFCVLFGHKIIKIRLYQPNNKDGTLGFVSHSYNKKNIYHQIGNFFIGIGPVIFGSLIILLLMLLFVPNVFSQFFALDFGLSELSMFSAQTYLYIGENIYQATISVFNFKNMANFLWWIFIILACSIALHMRISASDIKLCRTGLLFIIIILLLLNIILYLVNPDLMYGLTHIALNASSFIINFLAISILISVALILIALLIKVLRLILKR